jgi:hypothetical protein
MSVSWRAVNHHARIHYFLAGLINIIHGVSQMTKIPAALIILRALHPALLPRK